MTARPFYLPFQAAVKPTNVGAPSAKYYYYAAGTTTLQHIYTSSSMAVQLSNPLTANGAGQIPPVWLDDTLTWKVVIKDKLGATLWTRDNYVPGSAPDAADLAPYQAAAESAASASAASAGDAEGAAVDAAAHEAAALAYLNSLTSLPTSGMSVVAASRAALAMLATTAPAVLTEAGREGTFVWDSSNIASNVSADPNQIKYVPPVSAPTGASGAWVRKAAVVTPFMAGCVGDGTTNDLAALQAFNDWVFGAQRKEYADWSGNFAKSGNLIIGPTSAGTIAGKRWNVGGELMLTDKTAVFESVRLRNLTDVNWMGRMSVTGIGSNSFASRTCGVGFALENCALFKINGLRPTAFWYAGVVTVTDSNDSADLGKLRCYYCGSGQAGTVNSLNSNWTRSSDTGVAGGSGQRTVLNVTTFPDNALTTYWAIGSQTVHVRIGGILHFVWSWDRTAGTITVAPWVDSTLSSGTLEWVFGAALLTKGSDANIIKITHLQANNCGRGAALGSLYGTRIDSANIATCGTALALGLASNSSCIGNSIDAFYTEGCTEEVVQVAQVLGSSYNYINSAYEINLAKCWSMGNASRDGSNVLIGGEFGSHNDGPGLTLAYKGRILSFEKPAITTSTGSLQFRDQKGPTRLFTQFKDSQTVTLTVQGGGEFNELFGYTGSTWRYVGSGTNSAPTGTFTFNPPSGGTVNGGAADAPAAFSGFAGPVDFAIHHTDTAQLTWVVRPVAGWRFKASATWNPPSVASGASTTTTVALTGAALGDCFAASFSRDLQGLTLSAYVSAANTVTAVLTNLTGGAVDLASGTLTVAKVA